MFIGIGISLEDLLFGFFLAGIAGVVFEILERKKLRRIPTRKNNRHLASILVFFLLFFGLEFIFPHVTIYNHIIALITGAVIVGAQRRDLIPQIVFSGLVFTVFYVLLFYVSDFLYNDILYATNYNLQNLFGIYLFGMPIEEMVFAFGVGAFASAIYEYLRGYKTVIFRTADLKSK
ncbi:MAG: hypothetical protein HY396_00135 [Candidatus Doudnabacteria bacterium]|nr:hypothetical protein [Candidatus Doudnabacteria bacterium]